MRNYRYYWLKINDEFLNGDISDYILSQENGSAYLIIFEKLCLLAINSNGYFKSVIGDIVVSWTVESIARELKFFTVDQIQEAIDIFLFVGLITQRDGFLKIREFDSLIGSVSKDALRQRERRRKTKETN